MTLTKYPAASLKELWVLGYPMMLQSLSVLSMLFIDRFFLTMYSQEAFNASVNASTTSFGFLIFLMSLGGIAGVFVSQYNGLGQKEKLGEPVWQMIWFGVLSGLVFIPIALYLPDLIWGVHRPLEKDYFKWVMLFSPFTAIYAALCAFFMGQGKTKFISYLSVCANLVNIFFDSLLIFGIEGQFEGLGVLGAALATSLSQLFQVGILAFFFLSKKSRLTFGTWDWKFKLGSFLHCLKIGIPGGVAGSLEVLGWAFYFEFATWQGADFMTAVGVFQTFFLVLIFFQEGLQRGASIVTGYLIGSRQGHLISKMLYNGFKLTLFYSLFKIVLLFFIGHQVIELFVPNQTELHEVLYYSLIVLIIYIFIDGLRCLFTGILTATGDTVFLLITSVLTNWILLVGVQYVALNRFSVSILESLTLTLVCGLGILLSLFVRYKLGSWKKLDLSEALKI